MDDIAARVRAEADEDERLARFARPEFFTPECLAVFASSGDAAHVLRHGPDRALREVRFVRAILAIHHPVEVLMPAGPVTSCAVCITGRSGYQDEWDYDDWPCATVRALPAVWDGSPHG